MVELIWPGAAGYLLGLGKEACAGLGSAWVPGLALGLSVAQQLLFLQGLAH